MWKKSIGQSETKHKIRNWFKIDMLCQAGTNFFRYKIRNPYKDFWFYAKSRTDLMFAKWGRSSTVNNCVSSELLLSLYPLGWRSSTRAYWNKKRPTASHIACVIAHFLSVEQHSLTNIANLISYLIHLIKILWQKSWLKML